MFCSKCGREIAPTDSFCTGCGEPANAATSPSDFSGLPVSPPPAPPQSGATSAPTPSAPPLPRAPSAQTVSYVPVGALLDAETGRPLANWWRRVGAYLIDIIVFLGIPLLIVIRVVLRLSPPVTTVSRFCNNGLEVCQKLKFHAGATLETFLIEVVVGVLYFTLQVGSARGQSLGMRILKIAVRDASHDTSIGYGRAFLRWLVITALGWALVVPGLINFLSPLWDKRRQAWHDHAVRSVVVDLR